MLLGNSSGPPDGNTSAVPQTEPEGARTANEPCPVSPTDGERRCNCCGASTSYEHLKLGRVKI
jgi:hypothetical protein